MFNVGLFLYLDFGQVLIYYSVELYLETSEKSPMELFAKKSYNGFKPFPLDAGGNLNVHKTFRRRPGRSIYALCPEG